MILNMKFCRLLLLIFTRLPMLWSHVSFKIVWSIKSLAIPIERGLSFFRIKWKFYVILFTRVNNISYLNWLAYIMYMKYASFTHKINTEAKNYYMFSTHEMITKLKNNARSAGCKLTNRMGTSITWLGSWWKTRVPSVHTHTHTHARSQCRRSLLRLSWRLIRPEVSLLPAMTDDPSTTF